MVNRRLAAAGGNHRRGARGVERLGVRGADLRIAIEREAERQPGAAPRDFGGETALRGAIGLPALRGRHPLQHRAGRAAVVERDDEDAIGLRSATDRVEPGQFAVAGCAPGGDEQQNAFGWSCGRRCSTE